MANTSQSIEQEKSELRDLQEQLKPYLEKPKCEWPLSIMKDLHEAADKIKTVDSKRFYELMEWPSARLSNPEGFYTGDNNVDKTFKRSKDWFTKQGFTKYTTTYTYSNAWDRMPLTVAFYVPNTVTKGTNAPIMWFFHGGGYCTGANDHIPWFSSASIKFAHAKRAIIMAPDYPLGPEANYQDIIESLQDFLLFYKNNTCFEDGWQGKNWTHWLTDQIAQTQKIKHVACNTDRVFVQGESAGGNAGMTALFLNAHQATGTKIPIKAALLRYPMLAHYKRAFAPGKEIVYMNVPFAEKQLVEQASLILGERDKLEASGYLPTRCRSAAPQNMAAAFLLSVLQLWESSFKRVKPGQTAADAFVNKDCMERARESGDMLDSSFLPAMFIYHGDKDMNCPIGDTQDFVGVLKEKYPTAYAGDRLVLRVVEGMAHAFDYETDGEVDFLKEAYGFVAKHWLES